MQSTSALGMWIGNAILSKRILLMPGAYQQRLHTGCCTDCHPDYDRDEIRQLRLTIHRATGSLNGVAMGNVERR